jgi:hypothetical protein
MVLSEAQIDLLNKGKDLIKDLIKARTKDHADRSRIIHHKIIRKDHVDLEDLNKIDPLDLLKAIIHPMDLSQNNSLLFKLIHFGLYKFH